MFYVVVDIETGGRHAWFSDIVSCGIVVQDSGLNIIDKFYQECCPWDARQFDHETVEVHGLSLSHLLKQQSSRDLCINILHFLNPYRNKEKIEYIPFIYHAINKFDWRFVENTFYKNELEFSFRKIFNKSRAYSTIKMARGQAYQDNGLGEWALRLGKTFNHHNSLSDAIIAADVFRFLMLNGAPLESGIEVKRADVIADDDGPQTITNKILKAKKANEDLWLLSTLNCSQDLD